MQSPNRFILALMLAIRISEKISQTHQSIAISTIISELLTAYSYHLNLLMLLRKPSSYAWKRMMTVRCAKEDMKAKKVVNRAKGRYHRTVSYWKGSDSAKGKFHYTASSLKGSDSQLRNIVVSGTLKSLIFAKEYSILMPPTPLTK